MIFAVTLAAGAFTGRRLLHRRGRRRLLLATQPQARESDSLREQRLDLQITSLATVGCALAYLYPALGAVNLALLGFGVEPLARRTQRSLRDRSGLPVEGYSSLVTLACVGGGLPLAGALNLCIYHYGRHRVGQARARLARQLDTALLRPEAGHWGEREGGDLRLDLRQIEAGQRLWLRGGELLWVDAQVDRGQAWIDPHAHSGASAPLQVGPGAYLTAGTLVLHGELRLTACEGGATGHAKALEALLQRTADYSTRVQREGEALAGRVYPPMLAVAALCWPLLGAAPATALLFNAPQGALGQLAQLQGGRILRWAAEHDLWLQDGRVLERLAEADYVLLDKNGVLTEYRVEVASVESFGTLNADTLIGLAAAAEGGVLHPIADALRTAASEAGAKPPEGWVVSHLPGQGVSARQGERVLHLGGLAWMQRHAQWLPPALLRTLEARDGEAPLLLALDGRVEGLLQLRRQVRAELPELLAALRRLGPRRLALVSSDPQVSCSTLADSLRLDACHAACGGELRVELIRRLQAQGHKVAYVAAGPQTGGALSQADVSVCLAPGPAERQMAQLLVGEAGLMHLPTAFQLGLQLQVRQVAGMGYWFSYALFNTLGVFLLHFTPLHSALLLGAAGGAALHLSRAPLPGELNRRPLYARDDDIKGECVAETQGARTAHGRSQPLDAELGRVGA